MKEDNELEEAQKQNIYFQIKHFCFCVAGSTSSPRSLGLFRRGKIEKAVKSASQAVQNVSRRK